MTFGFWIPGKPQPQHRGRASVSTRGKVFVRPDSRTPFQYAHIRECFTASMRLVHYPPLPVLPVKRGQGWVEMEVWALFPPPKGWFPGMPYDKKPDWDNLGKVISDALGGKKDGAPALLVEDDCMIVDGATKKRYWDVTQVDEMGYPGEPGTYVHFVLHIYPRNPAWLPAGQCVCPHCRRDDFTTEGRFQAHLRRCRS